MSTWRSPGVGSRLGRASLWCLLWLVAAGALGYVAWRLFGRIPYRIDIDIYQMGAQAWLDGRPLYTGDVKFHTPIGLDLPFTYPPLAAVVFSPFAWLKMPAASVAITLVTLVVLVVSTVVVLTGLNVWPTSRLLPGPAWVRRLWLAVIIVAPASIWLEPLSSNFAFGQINAVLMTLVILDCFPRRTPWPRGLLLGLGIALKLTPAVFLLYFLLRRDGRAALTALASFAAATLAGFALAWGDSREYWTHTLHHTDRIGSASLNTDQNIAGALARLPIGEYESFLLWVVLSLVVLVGTVWAMRRVLRTDEPALAVICVALFGLVVSPVSWSHHWVWMLPAVLVTGVLAWRRRNAALAVVTAVGVALMRWTPIDLLPKHREATAEWWRQLAGMSYVWWALAVIVAAGLTVTTRLTTERSPEPGRTPVSTAAA
ncbi:MAG: glycosyltransferase 87 family protein [Mycobacterium pseudokansasii]|uniref:Polyprenol-phosphate-mannose-dependent alpha-(1-2)-phosphatidylinositol mannoside mannosyltransferase n=1 Tax=Mycobacterium pseudokansasii TaxID=2341080 RepID=A0A498QT96_9MYCO|nr:glycosyltransferase 87 family protein [Mycobacterium pseudokansasii]KZS63475.1 alpha-(1-2)-phosphatidylinositol mannosyltransferase [Mycobacterium kansasii]MBY0388149.1 glycosyltransferase 87 family protein [Mycobacterium pseudokansasii]VAZ96875.1 Polyprenol-phosphate-mannose-dependent alpha-(1-2)-phosphatidylinositol mannoside mannosyltransferase [Mycobacterium pseudokansasii]VAZ98300.1 Polyprenol-phosphate-mannose-dependent alpha-(1-2)-phosphatidylinositol mannoside mannosyltransferase [My